jgi:hypothetical protein
MRPTLLANVIIGLGPLLGQDVIATSWPRPDSAGGVIVVGYSNTTGVLSVDRLGSSSSTSSLGLTGVVGLSRIEMSASSDVFLLSGSSGSIGFVKSVQEVAGAPGGLTTLWAGVGSPISADYSPLLGEIFVFDSAAGQIRWAQFDPSTSTLGTWGAIPVSLSPLGGSSPHFVVLEDDSAQSVARLRVVADDAQQSRLEVTLSGNGLATVVGLDPALGANVGICGHVVVDAQVVQAFAPPGSIVEAFNVVTNSTLGFGVSGVDGFASIPVAGVFIGDKVGVRSWPSGETTGATRKAYSVIGSGLPGPNLAPLPFGSNPAATLYAGSPSFRVLCLARAPSGAPDWYPAVAAFGLPSSVAVIPDLGPVLVGAEVVVFPAGMMRHSGSELITGNALVPIPADLGGFELCIQWLALDGSAGVISNIARLLVQDS